MLVVGCKSLSLFSIYLKDKVTDREGKPRSQRISIWYFTPPRRLQESHPITCRGPITCIPSAAFPGQRAESQVGALQYEMPASQVMVPLRRSATPR